MKLESPAFSGHRPWAAVCPVVSTGGVRRRLDMETGRLLLDDGGKRLRQPAPGKTQRSRRTEERGAAGRDPVSRIRQEDHAVRRMLGLLSKHGTERCRPLLRKLARKLKAT